MTLGPIQETWLKSLEDHPERQRKNVLGEKDNGGYHACCLGEYLIVACRARRQRIPWVDGHLSDGPGGTTTLIKSSIRLGLRDSEGRLVAEYKGHHCLASMNDSEMNWPEIAAYVRANPENVFTKSL